MHGNFAISLFLINEAKYSTGGKEFSKNDSITQHIILVWNGSKLNVSQNEMGTWINRYSILLTSYFSVASLK